MTAPHPSLHPLRFQLKRPISRCTWCLPVGCRWYLSLLQTKVAVCPEVPRQGLPWRQRTGSATFSLRSRSEWKSDSQKARWVQLSTWKASRADVPQTRWSRSAESTCFFPLLKHFAFSFRQIPPVNDGLVDPDRNPNTISFTDPFELQVKFDSIQLKEENGGSTPILFASQVAGHSVHGVLLHYRRRPARCLQIPHGQQKRREQSQSPTTQIVSLLHIVHVLIKLIKCSNER